MIDFTFTEEQEMFRKAAREFTETKVAPKVAEMEETGKANPEVIKAMAEAEMMALTIPEEYGGLGLGYTARLIAVEEVSKVSVAVGMMLQVCGLGIEPILQFGSEEQKKKYLPGLATGERMGGTAVTETTGGSITQQRARFQVDFHVRQFVLSCLHSADRFPVQNALIGKLN